MIHLRSYAQKKPIDEYKQEAFLLFERLLVSIREEVTRVLMRAQVQLEAPPPPVLPDFITQHLDPFSGDDDTADIDASTRRGAVEPAAARQHPAAAVAAARGRRRRGRSADQPQRAMPVRLGQEVQALPRAARVAAAAPVRADRPDRAAGAPTGLTKSKSSSERIAQARLERRADRRSRRDRPRAGQGRPRAQAVGRRRFPSRL